MMAAPVCAIVGYGQGIAAAVAQRFGREGYRLAIMGRREGALEENARRLGAAGLDATGIRADAGDWDSLARALARVNEELGRPQVLVYNAFRLRTAGPMEVTPDEMAEDLRVNLVGALAAAQLVAPAMAAEGRGSILITGGGFAFEPDPAMVSLGAGKAGVRNLARSLHKALAPSGIHVATVTVCGVVKPGGPYDPDLIAGAFWDLHRQAPDAWEWERVIEG